MTTITDRIERELGIPGLASSLAERLDPSDLQSLLLDVYRRLVTRRPTPSLLSEYDSNRFVHPSAIRPAEYLEWDRLALSLLPSEFEAVELSPVCPLGASSAMAGLGQDWALSTIRNTEVVSDSTNVLSLEAASRRRELKRVGARSSAPVHLAASHRLLRTVRYRDPRLRSHFKVFSLCSAGRDLGNFQFEMETLSLHVKFYLSAIRAHVGETMPLRVLITPLESASVLSSAIDRLLDRLRNAFPGVSAEPNPDRTAGRAYYRSVCFWIHGADAAGDVIQLVDGGCVDWTQRLLSDRKERLLVSGIGTDRLCTLRADHR
ncbi:MAG TPA: hypothetical protein VJN70_20780 [Gemmatimonadaceae bacterium]|nr:hypothetical protein [Gemmatimonadaceae bacterium]